MSWRDAFLTLRGIELRERPYRTLGQIMVDLWAGKSTNVKNMWPLPFDGPSEALQDTMEQLIQLKKQHREWQQQKK